MWVCGPTLLPSSEASPRYVPDSWCGAGCPWVPHERGGPERARRRPWRRKTGPGHRRQQGFRVGQSRRVAQPRLFGGQVDPGGQVAQLAQQATLIDEVLDLVDLANDRGGVDNISVVIVSSCTSGRLGAELG